MSVSYGGDSITFADGSTVASGWAGFKNRIINGGMVIDQRNAGASFSSPNNYTLDRWAFSNGGGQTYTAQQSSTVPAGAGFVKSIVVTNTNSVAAGTTNYNCLYQSIEGYNIADLNWGTAGAKTVTASFWVRSSVVGTYGFIVRGGASNSYYVSSYSIPVADTWTYVTLTIPGCTTDTWGSTNALGLTVYFDLGVGSTYSASAGFWGTGNVFGLTGGIKFSATNGATFYATGVQLERGSTASSFEYRPYTTELQLCQRYYEKSYNMASIAGASTNTGKGSFVCATGNTFWRWTQNYRVSKRADSTFTIYSTTGASGNVRLNNASDLAVSTEDAGENATAIYVSRNASVGDFFWWQWTASAEL